MVHGLRVDERELLLTSVISATPDLREPSAVPSIWPFISAVAVGVTFICSIFSPWALVFGADPGRDRADRLVLAEDARAQAGAADHMSRPADLHRGSVGACRITPSATAA